MRKSIKQQWFWPVGLAGLVACGGGEAPPAFDCGPAPAGTMVLQGQAGVMAQQQLASPNVPIRICEIDSKVNLPNLVSASSIELIGRASGVLELPQLKTATDILIRGDVQLKLPALESVGSLQIV